MTGAGWAMLDAALLQAHDLRDRDALIGLYSRAAEMAAQAGQANRAAFFATHAWVFALEAGDVRAEALFQHLHAAGRA